MEKETETETRMKSPSARLRSESKLTEEPSLRSSVAEPDRIRCRSFVGAIGESAPVSC